MKRFNLGDKIGSLTIVAWAPSHGRNGCFVCRCECGNVKEIMTYNIKKTGHCGCLTSKNLAAGSLKHGMEGTRIYHIWENMKKRCCNPNSTNWYYYGGRGIGVCLEWQESFEVFYEDMKSGYRDDLQLERIDNDGDYEPGNCIWATKEEQERNKRRAGTCL